MTTDTTSPDFKSVIVPPPADSLVLEIRKLNFFYSQHQALFGGAPQPNPAVMPQPPPMHPPHRRNADTDPDDP